MQGSNAAPALIPTAALGALGASSNIHHVVIIIQENRTPDDLFNGLPGADTVRSGKNSLGHNVRLAPSPLTAPYDIDHEHQAYLVEMANGELNGFDRVLSVCRLGSRCLPRNRRAYGYVPRSDVEPYFKLATTYTFADRMFETNQGPSFPAHQYLISGTSTISNGSELRAASNAFTLAGGFTGGCDSPPNSFVYLIDASGDERDATYPCFDRLTLMDLLDRKGLSWKYYEKRIGAGLWQAPDAIRHLRYAKDFSAHVVAPPSAVIADVESGRLPDVAWVTPTAQASDHAGTTDGTGPAWVASVVNSIGASEYWNSTAIFVTWDDWGGWFDHVAPPQYNSYELGFRVPLLVISPYAKRHYVSHTQYEFASILKFTEETFGLGSLGTTDVRANDLLGCFNFDAPPARFTPIRARPGPSYFLHHTDSNDEVDY